MNRNVPYRIMSTEEFEEISAEVKTLIFKHRLNVCKDYIDVLCEIFPNVSGDVLRSIFTFQYEKKMKNQHRFCSKRADEFYNKYLMYLEGGKSKRYVLLAMAELYDISPVLLARLVLQSVYSDRHDTHEMVSDFLKDPERIPDERLSAEVTMCVVADQFYGPDIDIMKLSVGAEFEYVLRRQGEQIGMRFVEETETVGTGYDKTPDLMLLDPVLLDGTRIHWIESKALFADEELHLQYIIQQYARYDARYGTGLVVYWYGFVDTILYTTSTKVLISMSLPAADIRLIPKPDEGQRDEGTAREEGQIEKERLLLDRCFAR